MCSVVCDAGLLGWGFGGPAESDRRNWAARGGELARMDLRTASPLAARAAETETELAQRQQIARVSLNTVAQELESRSWLHTGISISTVSRLAPFPARREERKDAPRCVAVLQNGPLADAGPSLAGQRRRQAARTPELGGAVPECNVCNASKELRVDHRGGGELPGSVFSGSALERLLRNGGRKEA
jgi:hypothetical protein